MKKKIFVEYTGVIASHSGKKQEWVEVEENITVEELLTQLGYRPEYHKFIVVTANGIQKTLKDTIAENTAITLFLPAGGG